MKAPIQVPVFVHTIIHDESDRILLLKRCGTGFMDGYYCFPGGHVQDQEDIVAAATREVWEETGVSLDQIRPAVVMPFDGGIDFIFESSSWSGEPQIRELDKCSDLAWFPEDALPNKIVPFAIQAINCVAANEWFHQFKE